jgi:hypothetical protein
MANSYYNIDRFPTAQVIDSPSLPRRCGPVSATVSGTPFTVGDVSIEWIGWLAHSLQQSTHVARRDPIAKLLGHPCRHLIVRQAFSKKPLKIVDVLDVPNRCSRHVMSLNGWVAPRNNARVAW